MKSPVKDDFVVVERSVFPDKIGKVGLVTAVDPGFDYPYVVEVVGSDSSRFKAGDLRTVSKLEIARMFNSLANEAAGLRSGARASKSGSHV